MSIFDFFIKRQDDSLTKFLPTSALCTQESLMSPEFQEWAEELKEARSHKHRKIWEWCFICHSLSTCSMLKSDKRGLGFAVGSEPLSAIFANHGANILATDLYTDHAIKNGWVETGQHASGYDQINSRRICDDELLKQRVQFKFVDMNDVPVDLFGKFDFLWSSCALEHLGDLQRGIDFIVKSMSCLKPGGIAVHTTEYNVSSNNETIENGNTVLYRKQDIEKLIELLHRDGHQIRIDWNLGSAYSDKFIDLPPYKHETHLKLQIEKYVVTSIGLVIKKSAQANA